MPHADPAQPDTRLLVAALRSVVWRLPPMADATARRRRLKLSRRRYR